MTDLQEMYRARFPAPAKQVKEGVWKALVEAYLQRWVRPTDTVLDLGCGGGEFLKYVRCSRKIGVDLNPDSAQSLPPDVEFHLGRATELGFLPGEAVELVFASNLLEHLEHKEEAEQLLKEVRRVLKWRGHLLVMGPNLRFLAGTYWDFWDHRVPITDRSLAEILGVLGFRVENCIPRFLPYTTRSALPQRSWLVRGYLKMPVLWPLLGRQFLIRACKARE
jgi:dolichol-phosphate mannosyltransferase